MKWIHELYHILWVLHAGSIAVLVAGVKSNPSKNNIKNLTFEEKRLLILALVEKIEASFYEAKLVVSIVFRFAHNKAHENTPVIEPKKPSDKPRDDSSEGSDSDYGATDRARTCDLLLRREAF